MKVQRCDIKIITLGFHRIFSSFIYCPNYITGKCCNRLVGYFRAHVSLYILPGFYILRFYSQTIFIFELCVFCINCTLQTESSTAIKIYKPIFSCLIPSSRITILNFCYILFVQGLVIFQKHNTYFTSFILQRNIYTSFVFC